MRHLRDDLPLELVSIRPQFIAPYNQIIYSEEDHTICDDKGLLCFLSASYQNPTGHAEIFDHVPRSPRVHMFAIVYTYRLCIGPGVPFGFGVGPLVEYQISAGHWVSFCL